MAQYRDDVFLKYVGGLVQEYPCAVVRLDCYLMCGTGDFSTY